jgi:hypothetical protein
MATLGFRTANKRYKRLFWPMMALYVATILAAKWLVNEDTTPLWIRAGCAIATTAPLIAAIWAILRQTRETDEYTRARQLKSSGSVRHTCLPLACHTIATAWARRSKR